MPSERSYPGRVALRVEVLVSSFARPGREEEQQVRVAGRADLVALVRVEVREEAGAGLRGRAVLTDLDLAVVHVQPGVLVDPVVLEHLAGGQVDGDRAGRAVVAAQDLGVAGLDVQLVDVPGVHGRDLIRCRAMQIEGSGAIVVGGASGLGEATARALASRGAHVTIADVNEEKGNALADELGIDFVRADVTDPDQVEAAVKQAAQADGGLRISMHCAGVGWPERVASSRGPHQLQPFQTVVAVNLIGTFNALRFAAHAMLDNDPDEGGERGVCINTASIAAFDGQIGQIAYSASKGGVVGMPLPAARDLSAAGIRVNTIAPGLVDTPLLGTLPEPARNALAQSVLFPRRLAVPADFASLCLELLTNGYMNGETVRMDGGIRMPPK